MNIKIKFTIVIIVTLLIGMAIGFEISEISIKSRFREMDRFRETGGFVEKFEGIIRPDTEQKPVVLSILLKYHKMIDSTSKAGMTQVTVLIDSMKSELKKNLREDQFQRLEEDMKRFKNGPPPNGDPNRGPKMGPNGPREFGPNRDNRQGLPPMDKGSKLLHPNGDNLPPEPVRR